MLNHTNLYDDADLGLLLHLLPAVPEHRTLWGIVVQFESDVVPSSTNSSYGLQVFLLRAFSFCLLPPTHASSPSDTIFCRVTVERLLRYRITIFSPSG